MQPLFVKLLLVLGIVSLAHVFVVDAQRDAEERNSPYRRPGDPKPEVYDNRQERSEDTRPHERGYDTSPRHGNYRNGRSHIGDADWEPYRNGRSHIGDADWEPYRNGRSQIGDADWEPYRNGRSHIGNADWEPYR